MVEQKNVFEIKKYHHEASDAPFFAILSATTVLRAADIVGIIFLKRMPPPQKPFTPIMYNGHYGTTQTTPCYALKTRIA